MKISLRLLQIVKFIPRGKVVADIGTDHAYLPLYLISQGLCPYVIASEVNEKPYVNACAMVEQSGAGERIQLRLGDGFAVLEPGEVEVAVIAGVGGRTIINILRAQPLVTESISRFIFQPVTEIEELRLWLSRHYFAIIDAALVADGGHIYQVIVAEHGVEPNASEVLLVTGPCLVAKKDPLLPAYLSRLRQKEQEILAEIERTAIWTPENWQRMRYLKTRLSKLKEIEACL
jgi:tRNA (adenine22-N1)-methyltransferase